jgi:hypothetical protein
VSVASVAELRRKHVVGPRSLVVHWRFCGNAMRLRSSRPIEDDPRYWENELRSGECCRPYVPVAEAPPDADGYRWSPPWLSLGNR